MDTKQIKTVNMDVLENLGKLRLKMTVKEWQEFLDNIEAEKKESLK